MMLCFYYLAMTVVAGMVLALAAYVRSGGTLSSLGSSFRDEVVPFVIAGFPTFLVGFIGVGVIWGVIVLLWGLATGAGLCGILIIFGLCGIFGLNPGPGYVGAGAAEREQQDANASAFMLLPAVAWLIITGIIGAFVSFDGFVPWPFPKA